MGCSYITAQVCVLLTTGGPSSPDTLMKFTSERQIVHIHISCLYQRRRTHSCSERDSSLTLRINRGTHGGKLAADEVKNVQEEDQASGRPGTQGKLIRVELEWDIPMAVKLPVEVRPDPAHQPFPFLDTTLSDLGIEESDVKERVVWVDNKKTQVKNKAGKLKEKEITILEVRVKAQRPGDKQLQEVLYSTEAHTDRSFCRTGVDIQPWKQTHTGEDKLTPVQMRMPLQPKPPSSTETQAQREI